MKKTVIAGNWKMNMTRAETKAFFREIAPQIRAKGGCGVVLCVPFTDLAAAARGARGTGIKIGAQNVHYEKKGAYTGEISAEMLREAGASYVIVGHSERRQYFGETDETVNLRARAALAAGLKVIICLGEMLDAREKGVTDEVVSMQTKLALRGVSEKELRSVIIAYEPVWAIGTGLTATPEQADETCGVIRATVASLYGKKAAKKLVIQYGGSMNEKNAADLLRMPNVNGGLIGGASLKPAAFSAIVAAANENEKR